MVSTNKIRTIKLTLLTFLGIGLGSSCSDEFLDRPLEDSITAENFYNTDDQLLSATSGLYGTPWYYFAEKFNWSLGEMYSGNGRSFSPDVESFGDFSVTSSNGRLSDGWEALWAIVANANLTLLNLEQVNSEQVTETALNNAKGEVRFIRAVAYFYLVRAWGAVPIIEDNVALVSDPDVSPNLVADIYEFIERDLRFAAENCRVAVRGSNYSENGRVSQGSAKAMLAKVHLYQKEYADARRLAEEVINSGEFKMYGSDIPDKGFADLYYTINDNNEESIFALQFTTTGQYGSGNPMQAFLAPFGAGIAGPSDGYGVVGPTVDLQEAFEVGDLRRKYTLLDAGNFYPELRSTDGGYTVPDNINIQGTRSGFKKYIVGSSEDNPQPVEDLNAPNNLYIMRYAELFLIHAEAILGGAESTNNPAALASYNKVRNRAGLPSKISMTFDDLFKERRIELAMECDYWYDLGRIDRNKAIEILSNQERGTYNGNGELGSTKYTPADSDFLLPIPATDSSQNPKLLGDPVPYDFND